MTDEPDQLPASVAKVSEGLVRVEGKVDALRGLIEVQIANQSRQIEQQAAAIENARKEARDQITGARVALEAQLTEHKEHIEAAERRFEIAMDYHRAETEKKHNAIDAKHKEIDACLDAHTETITRWKALAGLAAVLGLAGLGALLNIVVKSIG